jgi:energy-coupling factor transport system substrate-specific component
MTAISADTRSRLWEVTSRTIVYAAIGAALYGILLVAQVPIPGSTVSVRPAFALVPFFGYAFGPIVGFFTGFVGNAIGDQISGWGLLTSWNWSLANGFAGLIAGLAPLYLARFTEGSLRDRAIGGAIAGSIAVLIGFLFIFTDYILQGLDFGTILSTLYLPVIIGDLIGTIILVPILVYAWEPVKAQLGR